MIAYTLLTMFYHIKQGSKMTPFLSWAQMGRDLIIIRLNYLFGLWKINKTKHE